MLTADQAGESGRAEGRWERGRQRRRVCLAWPCLPSSPSPGGCGPATGMAPAPLTFRQLAEYDDIAVDVVCDTLFQLEIYKVSPHYRSKRADRATLIGAVRDLARTLDLEAAYNTIVTHEEWAHHYLTRKTAEQILGFKEYAGSIGYRPSPQFRLVSSPTLKQLPTSSVAAAVPAAASAFRHFKRYLAMFLPKAGFEIVQATRYSSGRTEVKVCSTRRWMPGDEIRFCSGYVATLTPEEDKHLTHNAKRDFSVMFSTSRQVRMSPPAPASHRPPSCAPVNVRVEWTHRAVRRGHGRIRAVHSRRGVWGVLQSAPRN